MISLTVPPLVDAPIRLSQGHLNLLDACPRKFQYMFLDQLSSPNLTEQQERQTQGAQFHLLLQQWQLGLPIAPLTQADPQLNQWFTAFEAASPEILTISDSDAPIQQAEHERTLECQGYLLTMRYDLLLSGDRHAKILDWKTYPRPQTARHLAENWQTRLYLYGLAETSAYEPEQLSMVYWFFQATDQDAPAPQSLSFSYDRTQHDRTHQDLTTLLQQLTDWLSHYSTGESLPQLGIAHRECDRCNFFPRCFGSDFIQSNPSRFEPSDPLTLPEIATIQEIPL